MTTSRSLSTAWSCWSFFAVIWASSSAGRDARDRIKMTSKAKEDAVKTNGAVTSAFRDFQLEVAQRRLADAVDREDALDAIRDIVTNLLGSEEIALFAVEQDQAILSLFWSFGIDAAQHSTLVAGANPLLRRVIDGEPYVEGADRDRNGDLINFKAFVPIRLG